ncbi:MAG: Gfo/Idh/MocA family oxidoreductase [Weeksellaceae bacterium]|nr:Gfo/Idh/MocA family oxidoreductase [Weeksellaceae bacterium]
MNSKINAGVIGAGHLGKIHLKLLEQSEHYNLVGFHDVNAEYALKTEEEFGYKYFRNLDELLEQVEVIDIVAPTTSHYEIAKHCINLGKHTFIEKPVTETIEEAEDLIIQAQNAGVKVQIGHVERFNPAFTAAKPFIKNPLFIESHRLAQFNPRGTDVPVVLDLMIHDLDIILSIVQSEITEIRSSGVSVISESPDIANARLVFANGCVANITTSRISMKNMRKTRIFQRDAYVSVDFLEKKTEIIRMEEADQGMEQAADDYSMFLTNAEQQKKRIWFEYPDVHSNNAILDELESFAESIKNNSEIKVSLRDGAKALEVALKIIENFHGGTQILS